MECDQMGSPLTTEKVEAAYKELYGKELSWEKADFLKQIIEAPDYEELFQSIRHVERENEKLLVSLGHRYPDKIWQDNAEDFIKSAGGVLLTEAFANLKTNETTDKINEALSSIIRDKAKTSLETELSEYRDYSVYYCPEDKYVGNVSKVLTEQNCPNMPIRDKDGRPCIIIKNNSKDLETAKSAYIQIKECHEKECQTNSKNARSISNDFEPSL